MCARPRVSSACHGQHCVGEQSSIDQCTTSHRREERAMSTVTRVRVCVNVCIHAPYGLSAVAGTVRRHCRCGVSECIRDRSVSDQCSASHVRLRVDPSHGEGWTLHIAVYNKTQTASVRSRFIGGCICVTESLIVTVAHQLISDKSLAADQRLPLLGH